MTKPQTTDHNLRAAQDACSEILGLMKRDKERGEFSGHDMTMVIFRVLQKKDEEHAETSNDEELRLSRVLRFLA